MTTSIPVRNARAEAETVAGAVARPRVLEPSPPAVTEGPFLADDPVEVDHGRSSLMPSGLNGGDDWSQWLAANPDHGDWVSARWLGGDRRLPATPAAVTLTETRIDLHRLAAYVVAPTRHASNGKFGLRWTLGGFGTPFFADADGADRQVRVDRSQLIDQRGDRATAVPITSLRAAADFLGGDIRTDAGAEHDSPEVGDVDAQLSVDSAAADFLGAWFGMAFAALEVVRADADSVDASRPQLWPGHFDPAIEVGDEDHRASYGASPGDPSIDEPYLYVSAWWPDRIGFDADDPAWNAPSFPGAILKLSDFPEGADPVDTAVDFWLSGRNRLG